MVGSSRGCFSATSPGMRTARRATRARSTRHRTAACDGHDDPLRDGAEIQDEDLPSGRQNYWKAGNLTSLSPEAIDVIAAHAVTATSPYCTIALLVLVARWRRSTETETAYCGRSAAFNLSIDNIWEDPAENDAQIAWARAFPRGDDASLLSRRLPRLGLGGDGRSVRRRMVRLRALGGVEGHHDRTNFFRMNQNIKPST